MAENDSEALITARLMLDMLAEAEKAVSDARRDDQEFNLWIVGLSSSAIGLFALMEKYSRPSGRYVLAIFACFVLAIIVAVVHRWISSRAALETRLLTMSPRWNLTIAIAGKKDDLLRQAAIDSLRYTEAKPTSWDKWAIRIRLGPAILFVLGISILTAALGLNLEL